MAGSRARLRLTGTSKWQPGTSVVYGQLMTSSESALCWRSVNGGTSVLINKRFNRISETK